jgi:putative transposase
LWSATRTVAKTATVSLHGNLFEVDPALVGHTVELVFDPFDLTQVQVRFRGRPMGAGIPQRIGRHVHPKARPEPATQPPPPTGIDYLALVEARVQQATRRRIAYVELPLPGMQPEQPAADHHDQERHQ